MTLSEPSREQQAQLHQRIVQEDPIAFAELCEKALDHLVLFLRTQFPQQSSHQQEQTAIDCLLNYRRRPEQFDPKKLSLLAFLRMASRYDMMNAIDKHRRHSQRMTSLDDPTTHLRLPGDNTLNEHIAFDEWLHEHTDLSFQEILALLDSELDEEEKQLIFLMMEGVRESAPYAELLGIAGEDELSQRQEVKRAKDRLNKKLRRFGQRINRE